jgi:hypothetical protein
VGRSMMYMAEKAKVLAPEQYGSQKFHCTTNLAVNKVLTYDLMRQLKRPGAVCSNDAKSCYDLIGHTVASLAMQRMGVPKAVVDCLFTMLQSGIHEVRTGYGDSEVLYGGEYWVIPIHGIGQGNGAGPAIWAVVSTPLKCLKQLWLPLREQLSQKKCTGTLLVFTGQRIIGGTILYKKHQAIYSLKISQAKVNFFPEWRYMKAGKPLVSFSPQTVI